MSDAHAAAEAVEALVAAVNRADMETALAAFADDPVIIEDIAPFHWRGPGAPGAWLAAMAENAKTSGVSAIEMRLAERLQLIAGQGRAYVAYTGLLRMTMPQRIATAPGQLVFTLVDRAGEWLIETLTWSGPEPS